LTIRKHILELNDPHLEDAWAGIETFAAVALRVMAKTNPSIAMTPRKAALRVTVVNRPAIMSRFTFASRQLRPCARER
jgi:hypothetical protein